VVTDFLKTGTVQTKIRFSQIQFFVTRRIFKHCYGVLVFVMDRHPLHRHPCIHSDGMTILTVVPISYVYPIRWVRPQEHFCPRVRPHLSHASTSVGRISYFTCESSVDTRHLSFFIHLYVFVHPVHLNPPLSSPRSTYIL
jgi:hypothetical protein